MGNEVTTTTSAAAEPTSTMSAANATTSWATGMMMNGTFVTQSQAQFNQTVTLINNLLLSKVQALRSMHVSLGAFSLGLGLLMILRIVSDARRAAALQVHLRPKRFTLFMNVHPAETFPFALGGAIVIQQLVFISVQSTSLNSVLVAGCGGIAQVVFPTMLLFGYTTLVFSIETMVRALRSRRFGPRGKWSTPICLVTITILLLFTWIPTAVWRAPNRCYGSLVWFTTSFSTIAISIISFLLFMYMVVGVIILLCLMRTYKLDQEERVSASRICYYLLFSTGVYAFVLPFYIQAFTRHFDPNLTASRFAEVAFFSSGICVAFLHLFLRVNASRFMIQPRGQPWEKRPRIRFFGPSDLQLTISGPMIPQDTRDDVSLIAEKQPFSETNNFYVRPEKSADDGERSQDVTDPSRWPLPPNPMSPPAVDSPMNPMEMGGHKRKMSNYSLFPTRADDIPRLPATIYTPPGAKTQTSTFDKRATTASEAPSITDVSEAYLPLPSAPFAKHRRDSSNGSSATVQIGLRLSVGPAAIAAGNASAVTRILGQRPPPPPPPPAMMRRDLSDSSGESMGLPFQRLSPIPPDSDYESDEDEYTPEPPKPVVTSPISPLRPGLPSGPKITPANDPGQYLQDARNKMLPPTPGIPLVQAQQAQQAQQTPAPPPPRPQVSGLRMNPVTARANAPGLGAGTMSRSPPPNGGPAPGWI